MSKTLERILYVEDDTDIRNLASLALESVGGFTLKSCASGKEAIELAPGFNPDLLLLDVMMPGMDGPTTLLELRKLPDYNAVPVVFMTAKVQPQEVAQYLELGAIDVVPKPFDPMVLAETLKNIWEKQIKQ